MYNELKGVQSSLTGRVSFNVKEMESLLDALFSRK
jgi:hypothetical protein